MNDLKEQLKLAINFGINESVELTKEERLLKIKEFKRNLKHQDYIELFKDVEKFLNDFNNPIEEKAELLKYTIEFIRTNIEIEENLANMSIFVKMLYDSYKKLFNIYIMLDQVMSYKVCSPVFFEEVLGFYAEYLNDDSNEMFINISYSEIEKINNKFIIYKDTYKNELSENIIQLTKKLCNSNPKRVR